MKSEFVTWRGEAMEFVQRTALFSPPAFFQQLFSSLAIFSPLFSHTLSLHNV